MIRAGRKQLGARRYRKQTYEQIGAYETKLHGQTVTVKVFRPMEHGDIEYPPFGQLNTPDFNPLQHIVAW